MSAFPPLWENEDLRNEWLQCLKYQKDNELLTYKDWLEAEKDIAFDTFQERLVEEPRGVWTVIESYTDHVKLVNNELFFLRKHQNGR